MSFVERLDGARAFLYASSPGAAATSVRDLFAGVASTPDLLHPLVPFLAVVFYLLSKPVLSSVCARLGTTGRSPAFRAAALAHNALLASYSLWTSWHVVPLAVARVRNHGVDDLYCGTGMWDDDGAAKGLGFWAYLFYISKMYEVVDTYVVVVKRREPSYLQVYHHASTILCAYWLTLSHASANFIFVGFNSSVHAVMYSYYAAATLGLRLPVKAVITSTQMAQFVVGIAAALPMFFMRDGACANPAQKFAVASIIVSAIKLIVLFAAFYRKTYAKVKKVA